MTPRGERAAWWAGALVVGAALGWLIASTGGLFLGLAVILPLGAGRGRIGAAFGGALTGGGLAILAGRGLGSDLGTAAAALTLALGLLLSGIALRKGYA